MTHFLVAFHTRYCRPWTMPVVYVLYIALAILQLFVALRIIP